MLNTATPETSTASGNDWTGLTTYPLEEEAVRAWLTLPGCGAVVTFAGVIRDHSEEQRDVTGIEYEAYQNGAQQQIDAIVAEARAAWPELGRIALIHRHGLVQLGEASVLAGVSSPHRPTAFTAARFLIDVLKLTVPVWKLEHGSSGRQWVETGVDAKAVHDVAARWLDEEQIR